MSNRLLTRFGLTSPAAPAPSGDITFVSSDSVTYGTTNGSVIDVPMPTGVAENDVVIISISYNSSSAVITPPSGAVLVQGPTSVPSTTGQLASYRYVVPASPPSSLSFSMSANATRRRGLSAAFRGVNTSTPIDTSDESTDGSTTSTHAAPAITTTVANAYILTVWYAFAGSWTTPYPDTPLNTDIASTSGLSGMMATGAVRVIAGSGSPPNATTTTNVRAAAHAIALAPA